MTVIGSVGSGAEVVAGGSIHVYGALRGRAIAGAMGNRGRASSAAGSRPSSWRSTASTGPPTTWSPGSRGRPVQVWLEGEAILTAALD